MRGGAEFRACVEITDAAGALLARPGELCARVPDASLGWLEACEAIARIAPLPDEAPVSAPAVDPQEAHGDLLV